MSLVCDPTLIFIPNPWDMNAGVTVSDVRQCAAQHKRSGGG
ncbi:MAG: hypothetical protein ACE5GS_14790 [Kiloniellaceae bacterium]